MAAEGEPLTMAEPVKIAEFPRRPAKSPAAFRTISEVATELDVPPHVLRFWESKFTQIKPLKRGGGRRYYRPSDIDLLRQIRELLYTEGYTIKGVQKLLRDGGEKNAPTTAVGAAIVGRILGRPAHAAPPAPPAPPPTSAPAQATQAAAAPAPQIQTPSPVVAGEDARAKERAVLLEILGELESLREFLKRPIA
jgi:DNA-binding transcriptional MerR regulator